MKFRLWIERGGAEVAGGGPSLGAQMPETVPMINRGSDTPASDEVKRTGLQPQVDSREIKTKQKDEMDKILAIDGGIKRFDKELPDGDLDEFPKINHFRKLWDKLKDQWDELKAQKEDPQPTGDELGNTVGDQKYLKTMQQYPNMAPSIPEFPAGPGTFGVS